VGRSRDDAVLVGAWRELPLIVSVLRAGARLGVASLLLIGANSSLKNASAESDTRTLSFHHVHTGEDITVTFKRNGRYDDAALKKLNWFMRDWRKERETQMDPHLFDLLWEAYRDLGASEPIQVICGYRSPETNSMLRRRSSGVAQNSQHINGNAIDFYIPGVQLASVRAEGLKLQRGGVGFYPTSGSPFVHMDTGSIRHWPRIARAELAKIFPDGRTVHIPSDGHPMPGYSLALADVHRHGGSVAQTSLTAARENGAISEDEEQQITERPRKSLLAGLFGGSSTDENIRSETPAPAPAAAPKRTRTPLAVASLTPPPKAVAIEHIVPIPAAKPAQQIAVAMPKPRPADQIVTASLKNPSFETRVPWRGRAETAPALPPAIAAGTTYETALLEADGAGNANKAMAYAAANETVFAERAPIMGRQLPRLEATVPQASADSSVAWKSGVAPSGGAVRNDSPWLRAAMLTPSAQVFLTATRIGASDARWQQELLRKPGQSVMMTFSADPHLGMVAERFTGNAVVFVATATFNQTQKTAFLPTETTGSLH
jgi:uncharacterized protein YcbK (DUF882 family)